MRGMVMSIIAVSLSLPLGGCLAKTAVDVVTLPVRAAGKAVDLATTSQSEADQKRGREIRKREERLGQLQRQREKLERRCVVEKDHRACDDLSAINAEIQILLPQVPYEPDN